MHTTALEADPRQRWVLAPAALDRGCQRRLHIGLFLSGLAGGGAQRRMIDLAKGFAERGHEIDLVVVRGDGPFRSSVPPSVRLIELEPRAARLPWIGAHRGLWVTTAVPALARYLVGVEPEVLLSCSNPANLTALWARRFAGVTTPVALRVNVHVTAASGSSAASTEGHPRGQVFRPFLLGLTRRWYPQAEAVVAVSRSVAGDLADSIGVAEEKITTVYNPVDVAELQRQARARVDHPWLATGQPPLVLSVGKLKAQKDFPTLLSAFARLRARRPLHLAILGEGEKRPQLERLARELGIADDLYLPGFVDNPFAWMERADAFVLPSAWEGFSNVLLEALACGCPVISTDCPGGAAELLEGGRFGPMVAVGNAEQMADAIASTLAQPIAREKLQARAAMFDLDSAVDAYLDVLQRLVRQTDRTAQTSRWVMGNAS